MSKKLTPNQVLTHLLSSDKRALDYIEERALKLYKDMPHNGYMDNPIAKAWLYAVVDEIERYYLGVYPLNEEDASERKFNMSKPGTTLLSFGNVVKFKP